MVIWKCALEVMGLDFNFWKTKKVFLTGHTGFKGTWLSIILENLGAKLHGYSLKSETNPSFFEAIPFRGVSTIGDIRDFDNLQREIVRFEPEIIIHMAAQPLVIPSYDDPVGTYSTNVLGLVNLLDIAKDLNSLRAFLNVTSDKCYENKESLEAYKEDDRLGGFDPYSNSKACAELVTSSFLNSYFRKLGIGLASARAGNVIGGGDWSSYRLIPDFIRAQQNNSVLTIRNPDSVRPWQHVLEPLFGYLILIENLYTEPIKYNESWNFGPHDHDIVNVRDVINELQTQSKIKINVDFKEELTKHESKLLKLNSEKSRKMLGWKNFLNYQESIKYTVDWYENFYSNKNIYDFSSSQLQSYLDKVTLKER